jgi:cytochrome c55X
MPTAARRLASVAGLALLGAALAAGPAHADPGREALSAERKGELAHLLRQDCGACHGMELTGGLGPALTPDRLSGRSVEGLTRIILNGVPDTPMPPWGRYLSRAEAAWLARQLKKGR